VHGMSVLAYCRAGRRLEMKTGCTGRRTSQPTPTHGPACRTHILAQWAARRAPLSPPHIHLYV
ncbi:hypothetical protein HAX54_016093, partial [Datura stramonium]|nr:hypothetical protein [Datura stramonium]